MKEKTLFIVTALSQGGLETYLLRFVSWWCKQDCSVFCKAGRLGDLECAFRNAGVRVISWRLGYGNPVACWKFFRFLKQEKFAVVCDFTGNFSGITLACARLAGVKIRIAQYRGAENHFKPTFFRKIYNWLMRWITRRCATKIISNSAAAFDYFFPDLWRNNLKFRCIYNGVNVPALLAAQGDKEALRAEFGIPSSAFVIGHTGRYNYAKNHDTIVSVAIELCKKHSDVYFFLAGAGVPDVYAERVAQAGFAKRILMPGYRKDVPRLLSMMDVFYFPSLTEGQPNSLIEAEIAGLPIVASDIAPIRESVPESLISGLLPPTDVAAAVRELERLRSSESARRERVCAAWAAAKYDGNARFEEFREELETKSPFHKKKN